MFVINGFDGYEDTGDFVTSLPHGFALNDGINDLILVEWVGEALSCEDRMYDILASLASFYEDSPAFVIFINKLDGVPEQIFIHDLTHSLIIRLGLTRSLGR